MTFPPQAILMVAMLSLAAPGIGCCVEPSGAEQNCSIQQRPCTKSTVSGAQVVFEADPRPVRAMTGTTFMITVTQKGLSVTNAKISLDLSMPGMFMGTNRPVLSQKKPGHYEGRAMLPRCMSGNKTWVAKISIERLGAVEVVEYEFEVE